MALGYIGDRLHYVVYTMRSAKYRIISLRKANPKEIRQAMPKLKPTHIAPTPEDEEEISRGIVLDRDAPELDDDWFTPARPIAAVHPELVEYSFRRRGNRNAFVLGFQVYTDHPTRTSTIHDEKCRYYLRRKPDEDRLPDNWWHGPYDTIEQAEAKARDQHTVHLRKCRVCSP